MASSKRQNPSIEQQSPPPHPHAKRPKNVSDDVLLNPADCNLDFNIEGDDLIGHALYEEGFAYCWSGARGNVGITGGKYYFGCKIVSNQPVNMEDTPPGQQNVCRIGISRGDDPVGNLGETAHSYGFGGTGKFSNAGRFLDYGERFGLGDTILCLVDLESNPWGTIEFSKNGKRLGIAKKFDAGPNGLGVVDSPTQKLQWGSALFPHVLLKNCVVKMQFRLDDGLVPIEGYKPWACAVKDRKALMGPSFSDPTECEVIMMVGLPAAGKTTWAEKWMKEHPEKRYVLLGTNLALDQMKVPGLLRKNNYGERFDKLMDRATGIFNTLLSRASKIPRNYILDQTNVYKSARKRKLKPFAFYNKIAVVVFPSSEELKSRAEKRFREMGKEVPPEAVNSMLANFSLPMSKDMHGTDEYFDQVIFPEFNRVEAQQHLDEMKRTFTLPSGKSKSDHSPYSRESSVNFDSRMYSLPGSRHNHAEYTGPALGVQGVPPDSRWIGPSPAMQPYTINANVGYTGPGQLSKVELLPPCPLDVNTGYRVPRQPVREDPYGGFCQGSFNKAAFRDPAYHETYSNHANPLPREDPLLYGGYAHDLHRRHDAAYTNRNMGYSNDARAAYQPPHGSPYGTPTSRPYGTFRADMQHPGPGSGSAPYGGHPPRYY